MTSTTWNRQVDLHHWNNLCSLDNNWSNDIDTSSKQLVRPNLIPASGVFLGQAEKVAEEAQPADAARPAEGGQVTGKDNELWLLINISFFD